MPERMSREKINRVLSLVQSVKAGSDNPQVIKLSTIAEMLIETIDDIQEDILFLEDENERLKYEVEDKRTEHGRSRRGSYQPYR